MKFTPGQLWRAPGTVQGETGVHGTGNAIDVPVDPQSPLGRRIVADARANGFFVYDKAHGTGPHVHIEFNRNPDGSTKRGQ